MGRGQLGVKRNPRRLREPLRTTTDRLLALWLSAHGAQAVPSATAASMVQAAPCHARSAISRIVKRQPSRQTTWKASRICPRKHSAVYDIRCGAVADHLAWQRRGHSPKGPMTVSFVLQPDAVPAEPISTVPRSASIGRVNQRDPPWNPCPSPIIRPIITSFSAVATTLPMYKNALLSSVLELTDFASR
jgi:hypothetical protein